MLKLLALSPQDGWAFIQNNDGFTLAKPPYKPNNTAAVSDEDIKRAITTYGFDAFDLDFPDWNELLSFIRHKAVESNIANEGAAKSIEQIASSVFAQASAKLIATVLERIEKELIQRSQWKAALQLLKPLLRLDTVKHSEPVQRAISEMIANCAEGALLEQERYCDFGAPRDTDFESEFPYAARTHDLSRVKKLAKKVAQSHQVMQIGA